MNAAEGNKAAIELQSISYALWNYQDFQAFALVAPSYTVEFRPDAFCTGRLR
jgi:hypothetical protein